jgi:hypothetical protein
MTRAKTQSSEDLKILLTLRSWRPFDVAQDMLGARNFLEVLCQNISKGTIYCGTGCLRNQSARKSARWRIFFGVSRPGAQTRESG